MYEVLVVDDEARERNIIKILLERQFPGIFRFSEASNGIDALEMFDSIRPQLFIVDIKMPGLDGMEVVQRIKEKHSDTYIIIITAYNYFEYAKQAIKLGVNDLLLKPPTRDELEQSINNFFDFIESREIKEKDIEETQEKLEHWVSLMKNDIIVGLAHGGYADYIEEYISVLDIDYSWGFSILFSFDSSHEKYFRDNEQDAEVYLNKIEHDVDAYLKNNNYKYILGIHGRYVVVYIFLDDKSRELSQKKSFEISKSIYEDAQGRCKFKLKAGIGNNYLLVNELAKSYDEGLKAIIGEHKKYREKPIYLPTDEEYTLKDDKLCYERLLSKMIKEENYNEAVYALVDTFNDFSYKFKSKSHILKARMIELLSTVTKDSLENDISAKYLDDLAQIIKMDNQSEIIQFSEKYLESIINMVKEKKQDKRHHVIDKAIEYIDENYAQSLSIEDIAAKFTMSPFYFSKLFKEYNTISFIDYVTEVRINKAIELFAEENLRLNEIATRIGYNDANYFSRVFKKVMGMSPKEYRNKFSV